MRTTPARLRNWAHGSYTDEAAVELLLRAFNGRFANPAEPWIVTDDDTAWLDGEAITDEAIGAYSGGEQRLLRIVASLSSGPAVNLAEVLPGLDRNHLSLVLAAVAHASGTHEHATFDGERLGSLYPWPPEPTR